MEMISEPLTWAGVRWGSVIDRAGVRWGGGDQIVGGLEL